MSRIFISYRRADTEGYAGRLYDHLTNHFDPADIFMDVENIRPGADFVQVLEETVGGCDALLALLGPQWLTVTDQSGARRLDDENDLVRIEIATALKRDILVIPVLVQGAVMPANSDLPPDLIPLSRRNASSLSYKGFAYDVGRLAGVIKDVVRERTTSFARKPPASPETINQKIAQLKTVRDGVINFTASPLYKVRNDNRWFPVLGDGNPDAKIMFIGEAPGKTEVETGRPFIGPSGEVLDSMLASLDLQRADVYITNILKDRPAGKSPTPEEIALYAPFLDQEIAIIQPEVLGLLGGYAVDYMLKKFDVPEKKQKIGQLHGKLIKAQAAYGDIHLIPLYHPAVVLYNPTKRTTLEQDFQKLKLFT